MRNGTTSFRPTSLVCFAIEQHICIGNSMTYDRDNCLLFSPDRDFPSRHRLHSKVCSSIPMRFRRYCKDRNRFDGTCRRGRLRLRHLQQCSCQGILPARYSSNACRSASTCCPTGKVSFSCHHDLNEIKNGIVLIKLIRSGGIGA